MLNQETTGGTTQFDYDGNGSSTTYRGRTQIYDVENRLTQVNAQSGGLLIKAGYRWDGKRAWKENASGTRTYFLYNGDQVIAEMDSSGNVKSTFTWGATGLLGRRSDTGTERWYTWDMSGNVAQRSDASGLVVQGYSVTAYGNVTGTTENDAYAGMGGQYGYYTDYETSYILCTHRYYDPAGGRWLTRDPIEYSGGMNVYAYVTNNPVNKVDPSGLDDDSLTASVKQAIARGNSEELETILEASEDAMTDATRTLARNAIQRLRSIAQDWISKKCKGSINKVFPKEMLRKTIEEIEKLARAGNKAAQTAKKLLSSGEYRK